MFGYKRISYCFRLVFIITLLLLSFSGCSKIDGENVKSIPALDTSIADFIIEKPLPSPTIEPKHEEFDNPKPIEKNQLTLLAVGDNLIHIQIINSGKNKDGSYNYDHLFSNLKADIEAADISIINQETILGGNDFAYSGYPLFNSPMEIGDAIVRAGFDVVLHATNHAMDKGYVAIQNTLEYWKAHPTITVLGLNESEAAQETIAVIEKNGIKVAMLNYTYSLNGLSLPSDMPYLINLLDKSKITEDIAKAKELADFVIVFPHWGTEYEYKQDSSQKAWTAFFAEQGVDLVIGTHPHVLEPVEWVVSESGHRMLVYYSLGNYVSYQKEAPRMLGGIATVTLDKDSTGVHISEAHITPIVTHYENQPNYRYGVYKLADYTPAQALAHGVLQLEENSLFTLDGTWALARQILGVWIDE